MYSHMILNKLPRHYVYIKLASFPSLKRHIISATLRASSAATCAQKEVPSALFAATRNIVSRFYFASL
jgi:hypothetical protein